MTLSLRSQRTAFLVLLFLCTVPLAWHLWNIRLLYTDAAVRAKTEAAVRAYADREGFLLSDIDLRQVTPIAAYVRVGGHIRGVDPVSCARLDLAGLSSAEVPCAD